LSAAMMAALRSGND
jgi:hypothetical protein